MKITDLSPRQQEVARLVGQGLSDKLISDQLNITTSTVKKHLADAKRKVGAGTRLEFIFKLFEMRERA